MKNILFLIIFSVYSFSLSTNEIKHLLNRTSFGYKLNDMNIYKNLSKEESISLLLLNVKNKTIINSFDKLLQKSKKPNDFKNLKRFEKQKFNKNMKKQLKSLKLHWYDMMLIHDYSFREKMTLFWHNHFVSEYKVVRNPYFMHKQNMLFRKHALGDFSDLLHGITKDFAMLIYLDNNSNKKNAPNENFARELMELFTLGENNYTELDIKSSAKAFTGWRINKKKYKFLKLMKQHDNSKKTFFGKNGNFDGEDIINMILKNKQTSIFITRKLYNEFVGNTNNTTLINKIATSFYNSNYDLSLVLRQILLSDEFWNINNKIVKSPTEFMISLIKELNISTNEYVHKQIIKSSKSQAQVLFNPPSVQGWLGNENWINSYTLVSRLEFVKKIVKRIPNISKKEKTTLIEKYSSLEFQLK